MSKELYLEGIILPDNKWKQMKKVYDACIEADVDIPTNVQVYFNYEAPNDIGIVLDLTEYFTSTLEKGLEINVEDIPENVKILRFIVC